MRINNKKAQIADPEENKAKKRFKPFHETYKIVAFLMIFGLLYPNPKYERKRIVFILFLYVTITPLIVITLIDMYDCFITRDLENLTRHCTVLIPFCVVNIKILLMYMKRKESLVIINEISDDFKRMNYMTDDFKEIADEKIRVAKGFEKYWSIIVAIMVLSFHLTATFQMVYSFCFTDIPTRHMIHDTKKPFAPPEERLESPFFEFMFICTIYTSLFYFTNFIGYDGFFGVAINHACLKISIYCRELEKTFENENDTACIKQKMAGVIKEQCHTFRFVETIQNVFNTWLGIIFIGTVVQICNCMFQIVEASELDFRYLLYFPASIVHIYLPCRNATQLKDMSTDSADSIYCCGWERVSDNSIRKMIVFMIARAQRPLEITALNIFTFDMVLFVSILRTSYSMLTLLRS